jgi:TRAP-type transport system small permease protein
MYKAFMDKLDKVICHLVGCIFAAMLILVSTEIFSRYFLQASIKWSFELAAYLVIWLTFLGTSVGVRRAELTTITFVFVLFPRNLAKTIAFVGQLLMVAFLLICVKYGYEILAVVKMQTSPTLEINMSIPYTILPIGSFLILLFMVEAAVKTIRTK